MRTTSHLRDCTGARALPARHRAREARGAAAGFLLVALLLGLAAAAARAASTQAPDYRVQCGDSLEITLWNEDDTRTVKVDTEGNISYPQVGILPVKGLTVAEITERLAKALARQVKRPRLEITVVGTARQPGVYVLGAVNRPGPYELVEGMRVKDAIGLAGGLAPNADAAHATLNRGQEGTIPLDLDKILVRGDMGDNLPLVFGDVITVPTRELPAPKDMITVFVMGQVNRPGSHQLATTSHVSDAIAVAGGPSLMAALRKATLSRAGLTTPLDLEAILRKGDLKGNVALQQGDAILVPESRNEVMLLGEFQKPGRYLFQEGNTLADAAALGGGPTERADLARAVLQRDGKEIPIDLKKLLRDGVLSENQALRDQDVITIPKAGGKVTLLGEFEKTGTFEFKDGDTLTEAAAFGGKPTENADPEAAVLKRGAQEIPVNLKALLNEGDLKHNQPLQDGDVLVLPPGARILTYGCFEKPGPVTVTQEMKLVDVLLAAGGANQWARPEKAFVMRVVAGKPTQIPIDVRKAIEKGGPGRDFEFAQGDVLCMPGKGQRIQLANVLNSLYLFSLANSYLKIFRF